MLAVRELVLAQLHPLVEGLGTLVTSVGPRVVVLIHVLAQVEAETLPKKKLTI